MIWMQILVGLHMLFAGVFVGSNIFLDYLLMPRLDLIPPGQAARLGEKLGVDFAWMNWVCLVGLPITGILLFYWFGPIGQLLHPAFYLTAYGFALLVMVLIWLSLVYTGAILTWYLRPKVVVKLPYDASRQEVEGSRTQAMASAETMRKYARYNAIVSVINILIGGFLRFGGFLPRSVF